MRDSPSLRVPPFASRLPLRGIVIGLWCAAVVGVSVQGIIHPNNNFAIFRGSWDNLVAGRDLYAPSSQYRDLFKYSPTFALLFAPFAMLPYGLALLAWNALNAGLLYLALGRLLPPGEVIAARVLVFLDMFGSLQNAQSNALVAALIILTFSELARGRHLAAAMAVTAGTFIKVFPVAAGVLIFLQPRKLRFVALSALCGVLFLLAPLLVTSPSSLAAQYRSWHVVESGDALSRMHSVMQQVHLLFNVDWPNWPQQLAGVVILLFPLALRRERLGEPRFQRLFLASLLIFCVIFNHQSESPTFVIATSGVAIWFLTVERTRSSWALLAFVVVGTTLAKSELMPSVVRHDVVDRYYFKTVPCLVVWAVLQAQLWRRGQSAANDTSSMSPRRNRESSSGEVSAASSRSRTVV